MWYTNIMDMIRDITKQIEKMGGKAFLTGGFVRDTLLNKPSKDFDIEVYGLTPENLQEILTSFGDVKFVGQSFGVFKLNNTYDFTLPRTERKNGVKHNGFDVNINPFLSFADATIRRDLTINSLLMHPLTEEIIDLFNGVQDLNEGIIRHIDDKTFVEDPLRVLRVARFHSRFEFDIHPTTKELSRSIVPEMIHLSRERFYTEFESILLKSVKPSMAFKFLLEIGVLEVLFPELAILNTIDQGTKHHAEGNAFIHTMLAIDSIPIEERNIKMQFAVLTHDFGKAVVPNVIEDDAIHFFGHGSESEAPIKQFMERLTNEVDLIEFVVNLARHHMRPYDLKRNLTKQILRRLALKVNIDDLMTLHVADITGRATMRDTTYINNILEMWDSVKNEIKPIIKGRDLITMGLTPSKDFGRILKHIFNAQIEGEFNTFEEGIEFTKKFLAL